MKTDKPFRGYIRIKTNNTQILKVHTRTQAKIFKHYTADWPYGLTLVYANGLGEPIIELRVG